MLNGIGASQTGCDQQVRELPHTEEQCRYTTLLTLAQQSPIERTFPSNIRIKYSTSVITFELPSSTVRTFWQDGILFLKLKINKVEFELSSFRNLTRQPKGLTLYVLWIYGYSINLDTKRPSHWLKNLSLTVHSWLWKHQLKNNLNSWFTYSLIREL